MCNISPRGDADVRNYNACIAQLATYWEKHKVAVIKETESFFYGKDGLPTFRYFGDDGIHLSNSGIKRLLHAIDQKYTSQQILTCVPTSHVDREMGQNMGHDVWIHHRRLAALVAPLVLQRIRGIKTIKEAGTLHREEIIRTTGVQSADVLHVEWLVIW